MYKNSLVYFSYIYIYYVLYVYNIINIKHKIRITFTNYARCEIYSFNTEAQEIESMILDRSHDYLIRHCKSLRACKITF